MGAYTRKPRAMLKYPHTGPGPRPISQPSTLNPQPIRCLSLWQPWATAIALGLKKIETRSWRTDYRGPIAIHAAKHWNKESRLFLRAMLIKLEEKADLFERFRILAPQSWIAPYCLPMGVVLAVANLIDCVPTQHIDPLDPTEELLGDYTPGRFAWILTDITPLREPIPSIGRQGLYSCPSIESLLPPLPPVQNSDPSTLNSQPSTK